MMMKNQKNKSKRDFFIAPFIFYVITSETNKKIKNVTINKNIWYNYLEKENLIFMKKKIIKSNKFLKSEWKNDNSRSKKKLLEE